MADKAEDQRRRAEWHQRTEVGRDGLGAFADKRDDDRKTVFVAFKSIGNKPTSFRKGCIVGGHKKKPKWNKDAEADRETKSEKGRHRKRHNSSLSRSSSLKHGCCAIKVEGNEMQWAASHKLC